MEGINKKETEKILTKENHVDTAEMLRYEKVSHGKNKKEELEDAEKIAKIKQRIDELEDDPKNPYKIERSKEEKEFELYKILDFAEERWDKKIEEQKTQKKD